MYKEPQFEWFEDIGQTTCIIDEGNGKLYIGTAQCHEDDMDMMSRRTGEEIAYRRARIQKLQAVREELKLKLSALNQLYYSMNMSNRFNEKSYENKMLQRQLRGITFDLTTTKEILATERENLKTFIAEKDKFYKRARYVREKAKSNQEE